MEWIAKWLKPTADFGEVPPVYYKHFDLAGTVEKAALYLTALGVYEAELNGRRVGEFILAPGWTAYRKRLQYQEYDVTRMLEEHNELRVTVGKGWYRSRLTSIDRERQLELMKEPPGLLAQIVITYTDGRQEILATDISWRVSEGPVRFSELYDGEIYDANVTACTPENSTAAETFAGPFGTLIPQEGEEIRRQERISPARLLRTPKGEIVIDFGQEIAGYVTVTAAARKGETVGLSFAEILDREGNFYTENYRTAKCQYHYICREGIQTYEPRLTFWGFRYIRVNQFPGGADGIDLSCFTAVVLHSQMRRTGYLSCSDPLLNRLFENVIWGQKGNFIDVPTDCPQRDERLGWTGDAQVFVRTACLNYDVEKFFTKWLADMEAEQKEDGSVGMIIPDVLWSVNPSAAWGDAAVICPWQVYLAYGNAEILERQFSCMCKWVDYITSVTKDPYLWTGGEHCGDWLGLDAPAGSYRGSSREDFIASAFYAYSASLVIRAGRVLSRDISAYEALYEKILHTFRRTYTAYLTQTECVLAAFFGLAEDCQAAADQLAEMIVSGGTQLKTGFVGTPYLLHVLSYYGYTELAYTLFLRRDYPSWLYPVTKGATTVWEHWDGIMENGDFWSAEMNSFNHYAYGSVTDWVYTVAAGIRIREEYPGYEKVRIAPIPDRRLEWLEAVLDTRHGRIRSRWQQAEGCWRYEITVPVEAEIVIGGESRTVEPGSYLFYSSFSIR